MKRNELKNIISYVNDVIRETISVDDAETNDSINKGYFTEEEFIKNFVVEINDDTII